MDDLISRQAAIDTMQKFIDSMDKDSPAYKSLSVAFDRCIIELKRLPSAQPERKKGRWKLLNNGDAICSECGRKQNVVWDFDNWDNFCRHCGADMRGIEND